MAVRPTLIGQLNGGTPNGSGVYSGSMTYDALGDGLSHTYSFFSVGIDDEQKVQYAPQPGPTPDVTFSDISYTAPLAVENLVVEKGIAERSFIQYLDVDFNQTVATSPRSLQAWRAGLTGSSPSSYVELLWYGEGLTASSSPKGSVNLFGTGTTAKVSLTGNDLSINFGANGITSLLTETGVSGTGRPTSTFGDGWYALGIDPTGNPSNGQVFWVPFFRLLGSATGDITVTGPYTAAGTDAYAVYHAEGQSGTLLNADVNGNGAVNTKDLTDTVAADNHAVGATAPRTLPAVPVIRRLRVGGAGSTPSRSRKRRCKPCCRRRSPPGKRRAWMRADVRELESVPVAGRQPGHEHPGPGGRRHDHDQPDRRGLQLVREREHRLESAFGLSGGGELLASPGSPAADDVDLLTVLEHELGHVIGLPDNDQAGDLMDITLGLGVRRSPTSCGPGGDRLAAPRCTAVPTLIDPQRPVSGATVDAALASIADNGDAPGLAASPGAAVITMGPVPGPGERARKKDRGSLLARPYPRHITGSRFPDKGRGMGQSTSANAASAVKARGDSGAGASFGE